MHSDFLATARIRLSGDGPRADRDGVSIVRTVGSPHVRDESARSRARAFYGGEHHDRDAFGDPDFLLDRDIAVDPDGSSFKTPMLFVLAFFFILGAGRADGASARASVSLDYQVGDTYFVVAHLHCVLIGGAVFPLFGAFYYLVCSSPDFCSTVRSGASRNFMAVLCRSTRQSTFSGCDLSRAAIACRAKLYTYPLSRMGWDTSESDRDNPARRLSAGRACCCLS